jgi:hypothetical protein
MTQYPAYFAGVADLTGGTEVVRVNDNADLLEAEVEVSPGHWKLFPFTAKTEAKQLAAANKYVGSPAKAKPGVQPGNPVTGAISTFAPGLGSLIAEVTKFLEDLAEGSLWVSLSWILLGAAMLGMGVWLWLKKEGLAPKGLPIPVPV